MPVRYQSQFFGHDFSKVAFAHGSIRLVQNSVSVGMIFPLADADFALCQRRAVRRFHLPRNLVVALLGGFADIKFPLPHELVPVDAARTALALLSTRKFGGRHHTAVLHSFNKIEELRRTDEPLNLVIMQWATQNF
jgi:hypothetical protein